jgi:hypothetical protein
MNYEIDWREAVGTALCAVLSLGAFVPLVVFADWLPAVLMVTISLACPLVGLLFLVSNRSNDGGLRQQAGTQMGRLHLIPDRVQQVARIGLDV